MSEFQSLSIVRLEHLRGIIANLTAIENRSPLEDRHLEALQKEVDDISDKGFSVSSAKSVKLLRRRIDSFNQKIEEAKAKNLPHAKLVQLETALSQLKNMDTREIARIKRARDQFDQISPDFPSCPLYKLMKRAAGDGFTVNLYQAALAWRNIQQGKSIKGNEFNAAMIGPRYNQKLKFGFSLTKRVKGGKRIEKDLPTNLTFPSKQTKAPKRGGDDYVQAVALDRANLVRMCDPVFAEAVKRADLPDWAIQTARAVILQCETVTKATSHIRMCSQKKRTICIDAIFVGMCDIRTLLLD